MFSFTITKYLSGGRCCACVLGSSGLCWLLSWNADYQSLPNITTNCRVPLPIKMFFSSKRTVRFSAHSLPALFHGNSETKTFQYLKSTYFLLTLTTWPWCSTQACVTLLHRSLSTCQFTTLLVPRVAQFSSHTCHPLPCLTACLSFIRRVFPGDGIYL